MDRCMEMVRRLHGSGITVGHDFDIRERIDFYEKLCSSHGGILFEDYQEVREWMDWLMDCLLYTSKLGVPAKTQHNEVAPAQHELAPDVYKRQGLRASGAKTDLKW